LADYKPLLHKKFTDNFIAIVTSLSNEHFISFRPLRVAGLFKLKFWTTRPQVNQSSYFQGSQLGDKILGQNSKIDKIRQATFISNW